VSVFVTGATGYVGSYVVPALLERTDERLSLLVRARDRDEAVARMWRSLQLNLDERAFAAALRRIDFVHGDLHAPDLGLDPAETAALAQRVTSVLHVAASLNRRSERVCLNTNLRGTLSVVRLAMRIADGPKGLRRYTHVSTVAVAGHRHAEVVAEDDAIDWQRDDYDPYARTKKFAEHLATELIPADRTLFLRPAIVLGDSDKPQTTQFDMVRAFAGLADMPAVPLRPAARLDIVPANFVGAAIAALHTHAAPRWNRYHLSAGTASPTAADIGEAMARDLGRPLRFVPRLAPAFARGVQLGTMLPRGRRIQLAATLLDVFWPYLTMDTVFDNSRVVADTGLSPAAFPTYCAALYRWATEHRMRFPERPLPAGLT
jgi:thioester reductase-like protein